MALDFSGLVIEHSTTTWVDVFFAVLLAIAIAVSTVFSTIRELRYQSEDEFFND
jgi:hypothetical protein